MRLVLAGGLAVIGLLVGGCGGATPPSSPPSSVPSSAVASAVVSPSSSATDGNGSLVPTNLPSTIPTKAATSTAASPGSDLVFGADISWPQCPKGKGIPEKPTLGAPLPTAAAQFVILGLTNGPSFSPNPCLADQVRWVAERHLLGAAYAVVSYPNPTTLAAYGKKGPFPASTKAGRLSNVGYAAAVYNLRTMRAAGLRSPVVWVDVEPVPKFEWSGDLVANAAVVQGTVRGYTDAGFEVGFYSTPSLWARVVGNLRIGLPEWRAAGQTSQAEALNRCGEDWSIQGGPAVFGQWVEDGRDRNVTCPGTAKSLGRWFHQY